MKQSDLKEYIKEEIISVLSEDTKEDIEDTKELTAATKELADAKKELVGESSNPDLEEKIVKLVRRYANESGIPVYEAFMAIEQTMGEMRDYFGEGKYSLEETLKNMGTADIEEMGYEEGENIFSRMREESTPDLRAYFEGLKQGFLDNLGSYSLNEDIDDEEEADKAASKGAKKEPIGKISKKLGETQKEMKSVLVKFKKAEGDEKEKHLKRLKELTKIKQELEKSL